MKIVCPKCYDGEIHWNEAYGHYKCSFCGRIFELKEITESKKCLAKKPKSK